MTPAVCAVHPDRPGVAVVSRSTVRIAFRTDQLRMPAWAPWVRCWDCATGELDQHITQTTTTKGAA